MNVVSLSALGTSRLYPPVNIPGTLFCQRLSRPYGHSAVGRIMSMKNFNDTIENRTRDLPICSAVPQPTAQCAYTIKYTYYYQHSLTCFGVYCTIFRDNITLHFGYRAKVILCRYIIRYCSHNIFRVTKSRRMRWSGHVARMGESRGLCKILVGKPEGKIH